MKTDKCNRPIEYDSGITNRYYRCDKSVYARVSYNGARGVTSECLCKMHYNALIKNADRINKKTGFDSDVKTEIINHLH